MEKELFLGPCGSGFFSCCNIILMNIIDYFNKNKILPDKINNENMFSIYQLFENQDIYRHCFLERDDLEIVFKENISFCESKEEPQFSNYKLLNFESLEPFIQKYFSMNVTVQNRVKELKDKYKIDEQKSLCGVFYRGNDKVKETQKASYQEFIEKAYSLKEKNQNLIFLVQTDETEFLKTFFNEFPNSIYFEEIPTISQQMTTVACSYQSNSNKVTILEYYLASIHILSQLKNIICTSGNGEIFMCFFRKNAVNINQYLKKNKFIHGTINPYFHEDETQYWF